ncbi:MAG: glycosyltransferase family 2 protein, partial [Methylococcales bacterium]
MSDESPRKALVCDQASSESCPIRCAVVIPAYNEARTLGPLLDQVLKKGQTVIVVNDASTDETPAIASSRPVIVLNQPRHSGKGHALATGFRRAIELGFDFVITMDGDLQHDPADLPKFFYAAQRFPRDLIVGARLLNREEAPKSRLFANRFADFWISWASGQPLRDSQCGYRCI